MAYTNVYGDGLNSTQGANTIVHYYDKAGVKAANRVNVYQQFASFKEMPQNMGKTFKISKFLHIYDRNPRSNADFAAKGYMTSRSVADVSASTGGATLAEGAGAVNKVSIQKITMETRLMRYGQMLDYTDEVAMFSEDVLQVRYREELAAQANSQMEDLVQLDLLSTPTVMFSGAATSMATIGASVAANGSTDDNYRVSYDLIRKAVAKLTRNRAKKNTSIVTGDVKIGTTPVNAAYYAIIGPQIKYDLEGLTRGSGYEKQFVYHQVQHYANATKLAEGECGAMYQVRFIESEAALVYEGQGASVPAGYAGTLAHSNGKFNVYPILFPTQDAFATVGLKGSGKIKFNAISPETISLTNPYGTNGFFSYNFWYAGLILQEEKILKVLCAASA